MRYSTSDRKITVALHRWRMEFFRVNETNPAARWHTWNSDNHGADLPLFFLQIQAPEKSLFHYLWRISAVSSSGVDLFFVLSGYLIVGILLDNRNSINYFRVFYLRRICRISPIYYLILVIFFLLKAWSFPKGSEFDWLMQERLPAWSYVSYTQNIWMGIKGDFGPRWLGVTWSLAVEEQFYMVMPVIVYFVSKRFLVGFLMTALASATIFRILMPGFHGFMNFPWRGDAIILGSILAVAIRWEPFVAYLRENPRKIWSLFWFLFFGVLMTTYKTTHLGSFANLWIAFFYTVLIAISVSNEAAFLNRILRIKLLVWFGKLSYGIYMVHEIFSGALHGWLRHRAPAIFTMGDATVTFFALCLTLIAAALSFRIFEGPILRLGRRYHYQSNSLVASA